MDFMEKITELRAQKGQLLKEAEGLVTDGKFEEADQITAKMEAINGQIASLEKLADASRQGAAPAYDGALHSAGPRDEGKGEDKPFASLGEQLKAIYNFRKNHIEDKRLQQVNDAALGANEGTGADGGFTGRGFYGQYDVEAEVGGKTLRGTFHLSPDGKNRLTVPVR